MSTSRLQAPRTPGRLELWAGAVGAFRWAFMPVGLLALIALGVHAAADVVDERILWLVDRVDSAFDAVVGSVSLTQSWVHWVDLQQRVTLARGAALVWELAADVVLALPVLGYRERSDGAVFGARWGDLRGLWDRLRDRPSVMRVARPLSALGIATAGACAVARMIQGAVYLSLRGLLGDTFAAGSGRLLAIAALLGVLASLGWRMVLRSAQDADTVSQDEVKDWRTALTAGLWGTAVVLPLSLAALWDASPVWSFFR